MSEQLAYALLTPYSINKSRTGGILARLLARTGLELVAARMYSPGEELVKRYADILISANDPQDRRIQEHIRDYVLTNFRFTPKNLRKPRVMMLVFKGEDAVRKVRAAVGNFSANRTGGETIRDTYGDLILEENDQVKYFEPAVLAAPNEEEAESKLRLWLSYSDTDGGLLENTIPYPQDALVQRTLVLIKPDNFRFPTARPGNMIDLFSRTGLFIVGIKVHRMSVAEAEEFYGPVREVLRTKLTDVVAQKSRAVLEKEFGFAIPLSDADQIGQILCPHYAENQFDNIIRFMAGRSPSECSPALRDKPGTEKCIALIYEGVDAVRKIREVLGPTDPSKAPPGSIRREFGQTIMVNAAHASDSEENARREMRIINFTRNNFREVIEEFYANRP